MCCFENEIIGLTENKNTVFKMEMADYIAKWTQLKYNLVN